jgi:hypothetical protein
VSTNSFDPASGNNSASATTLVGEGVPATSTPTNTPTNTPTVTLTNTPTNTPVGVATSTPTRTPTQIAAVVVPTLSLPMLALLGLVLAGAALLLLKR